MRVFPGYPPFSPADNAGLLLDPTLDKLSLLSGITTVDDGSGFGKQFFDNLELRLDALVIDEFDFKSIWNHG